MSIVPITEPAELDQFIKNPYGVLLFASGSASELPPVNISILPESQVEATAFASLCGSELYEYLKSRLPTQCASGVTLLRRGMVIHQLDVSTVPHFTYCVNELHNGATLPPDSMFDSLGLGPSPSAIEDQMTIRSPDKTPQASAVATPAVLSRASSVAATPAMHSRAPTAAATPAVLSRAPTVAATPATSSRASTGPAQTPRSLTTSTASSAPHNEYKCCTIL